MRSKLNKFEHAWGLGLGLGRGYFYSAVHCPGAGQRRRPFYSEAVTGAGAVAGATAGGTCTVRSYVKEGRPGVPVS